MPLRTTGSRRLRTRSAAQSRHHIGGPAITPPSTTHAVITGPLVMIGFGSIGRGTLPLLERHLDFDRRRAVVVEPDPTQRPLVEAAGFRFVEAAVTREGYADLLTPLLTAGDGQGFCVNLSVDTESVDLMRLCRDLGVLYLDTVVEPWPGLYYVATDDNATRTNQALRERVLAERRRAPGGTTAVSCCGANPGMVSWFVKQALLDVADGLGLDVAAPAPADQQGWARLMQQAGVTGIHIAGAPPSGRLTPRPVGAFWNTWSVDGFTSEGLQPAELGWGTHERWLPPNARRAAPDAPGIFLEQPGAETAGADVVSDRRRPVRLPRHPQRGAVDPVVVHRAQRRWAGGVSTDLPLRLPPVRRRGPLVPRDVRPRRRAAGGQARAQADEIVGGIDELGVLLYGHARNAYWYGSQLSIEETRTLAPHQNATGLQVTSAVLAGMVWARRAPGGRNRRDRRDGLSPLPRDPAALSRSGQVATHTDWTPLDGRPGLFPEDIDPSDPWQFRNVLVD